MQKMLNEKVVPFLKQSVAFWNNSKKLMHRWHQFKNQQTPHPIVTAAISECQNSTSRNAMVNTRFVSHTTYGVLALRLASRSLDQNPGKTIFSRRFYMIKDPDFYSHSFFFFCFLNCDEIFVQFVQLYEYLGNASKVSQRVPPFCFLLFKRSIQNRTRLNGLAFRLLQPCETFFFKIFFSVFKGSPSILLKSFLVTSGVKRHIRTLDVIPELYCVSLRMRRRLENRSFHENVIRRF